jgi:hypothetical protein
MKAARSPSAPSNSADVIGVLWFGEFPRLARRMSTSQSLIARVEAAAVSPGVGTSLA